MSTYGDQTHCKNLDCVSQLEIGLAGYLLNQPRRKRNRKQLHKTSMRFNSIGEELQTQMSMLEKKDVLVINQ